MSLHTVWFFELLFYQELVVGQHLVKTCKWKEYFQITLCASIASQCWGTKYFLSYNFKDRSLMGVTALFTNMRILKFKSQLTIAFFAAVNHLHEPFRKQNFTLTGSKGHGLWFLIGGFWSVWWVSVCQGSLLLIVIMIDSNEKRNCEGGFWTLEFASLWKTQWNNISLLNRQQDTPNFRSTILHIEMNISKCGKLNQIWDDYWLFSKMEDLLSLIPRSSTFQGGGWVKFPTLGMFRARLFQSLVKITQG